MTKIPLSNTFDVDPMGQQSMFDMYINLATIYPLPHPSAKYSLLTILSSGIVRMSQAFPWFHGSVEKIPDSTKYTVRTDVYNDILHVEDFTEDPVQPSFVEFKARKFPTHMLDEDRYSLRHTMSGHPKDLAQPVNPVFMVKANFIPGGVILFWSGHHIVFDMNGMAATMEMLSRCCKGEELTAHDIKIGNKDRKNLVDVSNFSIPENNNINTGDFTIPEWFPSYTRTPEPTDPEWHYFLFEKEDLDRLKADVSKTKPADCEFISTDDALSALVWQCVTATRARGKDPQEPIKFLRVVDVRKYLGVDKDHPGVFASISQTTETLVSLLDMSLGQIAATLRKGLAEAPAINAKIIIKHALDPKSEILPPPIDINPANSVCVTSWSKVGVYSLDFGLGLGTPEAVRRGTMPSFGGVAFFMPKRGDGQVAVSLCLTKKELALLISDPLWQPYCTLV